MSEPIAPAVASEYGNVVPSHDPMVVLVEDDPQIRRLLRTVLPNHGFRVIDVGTAAEGLQELELHRADILLLDLGLPDLDGMQVIQRLREWSAVPILVLSARKQERDKIGALDAGADDYVSKPFSVGELLSRMRVVLRRSGRTSDGHSQLESPLVMGSLQVDLARRRVMRAGQEVHLTPIEYRLLAVLVRDAGKVLTQRQLLTEVWGPPLAEEVQYLRVYMAQLRRKLEDDPARPKILVTEPGVGYRLAAE